MKGESWVTKRKDSLKGGSSITIKNRPAGKPGKDKAVNPRRGEN